MSATDEAIRSLTRGVAQATVELVAERIRECDTTSPKALSEMLYSTRHIIADQIVTATMACAEEDPESEVHALRATP